MPTLTAIEEIVDCAEKPDRGVQLMHSLIVQCIEHREGIVGCTTN